jgi:hypothetical protein
MAKARDNRVELRHMDRAYRNQQTYEAGVISAQRLKTFLCDVNTIASAVQLAKDKLVEERRLAHVLTEKLVQDVTQAGLDLREFYDEYVSDEDAPPQKVARGAAWNNDNLDYIVGVHAALAEIELPVELRHPLDESLNYVMNRVMTVVNKLLAKADLPDDVRRRLNELGTKPNHIIV